MRVIFNGRGVKAGEVAQGDQWPKTYTCSFLEQGLVSYEDSNAGVALLRKQTIDKMLNSIIGKPVIIQHKDVDPTNYKEHAVGYVTNAKFNPEDGWFYADFLVTDKAGHERIKGGDSVSCGFKVLNTTKGGEWHAIKFDEEITDGEFEHLALVTTPRYEDCRILVNSKTATVNKEEKVMFGFLKKKNEKGELEKVKTDLSKHFVKLENGKKISLKELLELKNAKLEEDANTHDIEDVIETEDGKEMKISDLMDLVNDKSGKEVDPNDPAKKKWAEKSDEDKDELSMKKHGKKYDALNEKEKEDLEKENSDGKEEESKREKKEEDDAEKEEKKASKSKNSKEEKEGEEHFVRLNSHRKQSEDAKLNDLPQTQFERVALGTSRYGSNKK